MVLMPFLGIASLIALGTVLVLGISMLEMLAKRADKAPVQLEELRGQVSQLSAKIKELELKQETLAASTARVAKLANELYLERPLNELDEKRIRLMKLPPAELLRQGIAALSQEGARPALYFEAILNAHPDSTEAPAAMLQLGILRVRGGATTPRLLNC
jgi:TolA-binding protein